MECKYSDIILPHPDVSSPAFEEQVESLVDVLDEIIESMLSKICLTTEQEIDEVHEDLALARDTPINHISGLAGTQVQEGQGKRQATSEQNRSRKRRHKNKR
jgi:hypothetical protein